MNDPIHTLAQIVTACRVAEEKRRFSSAISDIHRIAADAIIELRQREHEVLRNRANGLNPHPVDAASLKARRVALGLLQGDLAGLLGTSIWNIKQWEQGRYKVPPLLHLALYALESGPPPGYEWQREPDAAVLAGGRDE